MAIEELEAHLRRNPDDRASWLVYGDHLLGRGDVRGELPRLTDAERAARIVEHEPAWRDELPDVTVTAWCHGFARGIEVAWGDGAPELIRTTLARPAARFVGTLRIARTDRQHHSYEEDYEEHFDEDGQPLPLAELDLAPLAEVDLARLAALDLSYLHGGDAVVRAVAACASLTDLATLDLRYGALTDDGATALAGATQLSGLRTLHLQRNLITARGAAALAEAEHLRELTTLDLRYNAIGEAGAAALSSATFAARLVALHLYRDDVTAEGAAVLARSTKLPAPIRGFWGGTR